MPEYPDNSHSARENTSPPSKRVEKVVNGTAKTRKQSEVKKFAGIFMPDEVGARQICEWPTDRTGACNKSKAAL